MKFKRDKFKSARGGHSRLIKVSCNKCKSLVCTYQKDGPGSLKRMYFDRIFSPPNLSNLQKKKITSVSPLKCKKCGELLGTPYIYKKENRKAIRLYQDSITKKISKLK